MADYSAFPLWIEEGPGHGNIDPRTLGVSASLVTALRDWAAEYDGILNLDDPASSGFRDVATELTFVANGRELAKRLAHELRGRFKVKFFHASRLGDFELEE
jgi:hypothetical protein